MLLENASSESTPDPPPGDRDTSSGSRLLTVARIVMLVTTSIIVGTIAGRWGHPFSAIVLGLPGVVLAAWISGRLAIALVVLGTMTAWGFIREPAEVESVGSTVLTFTVSLLMLLSVGGLIESLLRTRERAAQLARTEPLTGLLNQNAFVARLESELSRPRREGHALAVAFLDCDHFKALNDTRGHRAGDELLRIVAETLRSETRHDDVVARLGGDEFALLFPEISAENAERAVHRLHAALRQTMTAHHGTVTVSIGLAVFETPPTSTVEVTDMADRLMYEAKNSGKDRVVSTHPPAPPPETFNS